MTAMSDLLFFSLRVQSVDRCEGKFSVGGQDCDLANIVSYQFFSKYCLPDTYFKSCFQKVLFQEDTELFHMYQLFKHPSDYLQFKGEHTKP